MLFRSHHSGRHAATGVDRLERPGAHAPHVGLVRLFLWFPIEAVQTNILGSHNVIESAVKAKAECVVCLGTDKAVYPVNAMGMTKALMEKTAQSIARRLSDSDTRVCSVRYGNVMYSRGSVIPLFVQQIKDCAPLTITDPNMTRFMLPLRDSVELVEFAFAHGRQGDVFIKKAPACTIGDLAKAMLELFQSNCEIKAIGMRHGEKLHETLASVQEIRRAEDMGNFLRIQMDDRDLNYSKYFTEGEVLEAEVRDYDSDSTAQLSLPEVKELLLSLPEVQAELSQHLAQLAHNQR